jgi:hypothetical protein
MLAVGKRNPEMTITKSTVSSIRHDDSGEVQIVQISGEVNPGNSGGPVVDSACKVVGVAQSKIGGTQTAFAVTPESLQGFLKGQVKTTNWRVRAAGPNRVTMEATIEVIDPLGTLRSVSAGYVREDRMKEPYKARPHGTWGKVDPSVKEVAIKVEDGKGSATVDLNRSADDPMLVTFLVQAHYVQSDGTSRWTDPASLDVEFTN